MKQDSRWICFYAAIGALALGLAVREANVRNELTALRKSEIARAEALTARLHADDLAQRSRLAADRYAQLKKLTGEFDRAHASELNYASIYGTLNWNPRWDATYLALELRKKQTASRVRYAALISRLGWSEERIAAFEKLEGEFDARDQDIRMVGSSMNAGDTSPEVASLLAQNRADRSKAVAELLGPDDAAALRTFDGEAYGRWVRARLDENLAEVSVPLSPDQSSSLIALVQASQTGEWSVATDAIHPPEVDWDTVRAKAASFLTAAQLLELDCSIASERYRYLQGQFFRAAATWEASHPSSPTGQP